MIEYQKIKEDVYSLLKDDTTGHDISHIERVLDLSLEFSENLDVNREKLSLIALLHDVDDYKLFVLDTRNLPNAKKILKKYKINKSMQEEVLSEIKRLGYSKRLEGLKPLTIEGMIVSDADMCDAMGVTGIIRCYDYSKSHNMPFFLKENFPLLDINAKTYKEKNSSCLNHFFEKLLRLPNFMLTEMGRKEALKRKEVMVIFLKNFFLENKLVDWLTYLENYLKIIDKEN